MSTNSLQEVDLQQQVDESDGLASLLQKEFKPRTDQARDAVENAVKTFRRYCKCKQIYRKMWKQGKDLRQLTVSA